MRSHSEATDSLANLLERPDAMELLADMVADRIAAKLANQPQRRFLSRKEYALSRGLGVRTVDRAIAQNRLATTRHGGRVLIPADAEIKP